MAEEEKKLDLNDLNPTDAKNKIGALYADLGEDATTILADHMDQMNEAQEFVTSIVASLIDAQEKIKALENDNMDLKATNVKLMMSKIVSEPETKGEAKQIEDLSQAIDELD